MRCADLHRVSIVSFVLLVSALALGAAGDEKAQAVSKSDRRPLIVMRQAEITGKVYFLADDQSDEATAADQRVQVLTANGQTNVYETITDKTGGYVLPNLQAGTYQLVVGRLNLELQVLDAEKAAAGGQQAAKTILVLIPRSLGEPARRKPDQN